MIYVELFAYLKTKIEDREKLIEKLRIMGYNITTDMFPYFKQKQTSIPSLIKKTLRKISSVKKIKLIKDFKDGKRGFYVIINRCPLCTLEIEEERIQYCILTMAIIERILNLAIENGIIKNYKKVEGKVLKSVSCGDDCCKYYYKVIE